MSTKSILNNIITNNKSSTTTAAVLFSCPEHGIKLLYFFSFYAAVSVIGTVFLLKHPEHDVKLLVYN